MTNPINEIVTENLRFLGLHCASYIQNLSPFHVAEVAPQSEYPIFDSEVAIGCCNNYMDLTIPRSISEMMTDSIKDMCKSVSSQLIDLTQNKNYVFLTSPPCPPWISYEIFDSISKFESRIIYVIDMRKAERQIYFHSHVLVEDKKDDKR
jgi:hypothetical protein